MSKLLLSAVVAAVLAAPTSALAVSFDFTGPTQKASSLSFTSGGITVTATPSSYIDAFDFIVATPFSHVTQNGEGLGVDLFDISTPLGPLEGDPPEINGPIDLLVLTFDREVTLNSITFGGVDADDDFDLALDGDFILEDVNIAQQNPYIFALGLTGTSIAIGADAVKGLFSDSTDDFRIAGLDVDAVSAVPVPAALPLLLAALAGLGFVSRRRRDAA